MRRLDDMLLPIILIAFIGAVGVSCFNMSYSSENVRAVAEVISTTGIY